MRQSERQAIRAIKSRVRANAYIYSEEAWLDTARGFLHEDDVKRAVSTARLVTVAEDDASRMWYTLCGFGTDEEPIMVVCRVRKAEIEIASVFRLTRPDPQAPGGTFLEHP